MDPPVKPKTPTKTASMENFLPANNPKLETLAQQASGKLPASKQRSLERAKTMEPPVKRDLSARRNLFPSHSDKVKPDSGGRKSSIELGKEKSVKSTKTNSDQTRSGSETQSVVPTPRSINTKAKSTASEGKSDSPKNVEGAASKNPFGLEEMLVDFLVMYDIIEEEDNDAEGVKKSDSQKTLSSEMITEMLDATDTQMGEQTVNLDQLDDSNSQDPEPCTPRERPLTPKQCQAVPKETSSRTKEGTVTPKRSQVPPKETSSRMKERTLTPKQSQAVQKETLSRTKERTLTPKKSQASPKKTSSRTKESQAAPKETSSGTKEGTLTPKQSQAAPKETSSTTKEGTLTPKENQTEPKVTLSRTKEGKLTPKQSQTAPKETSSGTKEGMLTPNSSQDLSRTISSTSNDSFSTPIGSETEVSNEETQSKKLVEPLKELPKEEKLQNKEHRKKLDMNKVDAMRARKLTKSQTNLIAFATQSMGKQMLANFKLAMSANNEFKKTASSSAKPVLKETNTKSTVLQSKNVDKKLTDSSCKQPLRQMKSVTGIPKIDGKKCNESGSKATDGVPVSAKNTKVAESPKGKWPSSKQNAKTDEKKPIAVEKKDSDATLTTPNDKSKVVNSVKLLEAIETDYKKRLSHFFKLTSKLTKDQDFVMKRYNQLNTIYEELESQSMDVKPVGSLSLVSLDKVRDYLIVGQLVNNAKCAIEHQGNCDELRDDVLYNVCVPNKSMIVGDEFVESYAKRLEGVMARAEETCRITLAHLNEVLGWVGNMSSQAGLVLNCEAVHERLFKYLKIGREVMAQYNSLKDDICEFKTTSKQEIARLMKQSQLLLQLEIEVTKKLSALKISAKYAELNQEETDKLAAQLKETADELQKERTLRKYLESSKEAFISEIYKVRADLRKIDEGYAILSKKGVKIKDEIRNLDQKLFSKDMMTHSRMKDYEKMNKHAEGIVERYKLRCRVLEESISDIISDRNENESNLKKQIEDVKNEVHFTLERQKEERHLRKYTQKQLKLSQKYIKESEADVKRLIDLNDPMFKSPYPMIKMPPTEAEQQTWLELQRTIGQLEVARKEIERFKSERDAYQDKLKQLTMPNTKDEDGETPNDNSMALVAVVEAKPEATDTTALSKEVEAFKHLVVEKCAEIERLHGVMCGDANGKRVSKLARDNAGLRNLVERQRREKEKVAVKMEQLKAELLAKMYECSQREKVMSARLETFEARDKLISLVNKRQGEVSGDSLGVLDASARLKAYEKARTLILQRERDSMQRQLEWDSVETCMAQLDGHHHAAERQRVAYEKRIVALETRLLCCSCQGTDDVRRLWDI